MPLHLSPLRYPGGKASLRPLMGELIKSNGLARNGVYVEPYAGGAGAALELLLGEYVDYIHLNDLDDRIYRFWWSILNRFDEFVDRIATVPLNVGEWEKQRKIYLNPGRRPWIDIGFSAFYLNRTNRSGILANAGPIGGKKQNGNYLIDARFDRERLIKRIDRVHSMSHRIELSNVDALTLLKDINRRPSYAKRCLIYLDPPYYVKGSQLYLNAYAHKDHAELAKYLSSSKRFQWVMSYDNTLEIRDLYRCMTQVPFDLAYSVYTSRNGSELLIHNHALAMPDGYQELLPRPGGKDQHAA